MPDLRSSYDKALLAAAGLVAVATSLYIASGAITARDEAVLPPSNARQEPFASDATIDTLKADRADSTERKPWGASEASPFVSRVYLLKDDRLVDILESGTELFPGISNAWIIEHDLNYLDPALPEADPDADGFTNFEEFAAKTNPTDAGSKPAEWTKLRLGDVRIEQLQIIFTGKDYKGRASINSVAASADSLRGEPIGPTTAYTPNDPATPSLKVRRFKTGFQTRYEEEDVPFRLVGFKEEMRANPTIILSDGRPQMDRIEIAVLESTSGDGTKVELEAGKAETSPYSLAQLIDVRPGGQVQEVRIGASFKLDPSGRYKLVDVSEENATILDLDSGEKRAIPKAVAPAPQATPEDVQPQ